MRRPGYDARAGGKLPSLPLMGRVADSLPSAGWGEPHHSKFPPTRRASRLGSCLRRSEALSCPCVGLANASASRRQVAKIGTRPPNVGGGLEQAALLRDTTGAACYG